MAVSYKKLQHILIERDISHSQLMRMANISANIISKLKTGQYIALDKVESICNALNCTPNDILVFIPDDIDNVNSLSHDSREAIIEDIKLIHKKDTERILH